MAKQYIVSGYRYGDQPDNIYPEVRSSSTEAVNLAIDKVVDFLESIGAIENSRVLLRNLEPEGVIGDAIAELAADKCATDSVDLDVFRLMLKNKQTPSFFVQDRNTNRWIDCLVTKVTI